MLFSLLASFLLTFLATFISFFIVFVAINTLDIGAAYRLSGISLSGCKDAVEKTLPSMF